MKYATVKAIPKHLRGKQYDEIMDLYDAAVADELKRLLDRYYCHAQAMIYPYTAALQELTCMSDFENSKYCNIPAGAVIAQAVLKGDATGLMAVMTKLFDDTIQRQAEHIVEENQKDDEDDEDGEF